MISILLLLWDDAIMLTLSINFNSESRIIREKSSLPETQTGSHILNLPMLFSMAEGRKSSLSQRQRKGP